MHSSQSHRQQQTSVHPKMRSSAKFREKFKLIAVQGHPRSSTLVPI